MRCCYKKKKKDRRFDDKFDRSVNKKAPATTMLQIRNNPTSSIITLNWSFPTVRELVIHCSSCPPRIRNCILHHHKTPPPPLRLACPLHLSLDKRRHDNNYGKILLQITINHSCQWLDVNNAKRLQSNPLIKNIQTCYQYNEKHMDAETNACF